MDKLLRRNGLNETRHQLKYSTSSSKRLLSAKKEDLDQSMASTKRDFHQSRICRCKQQSPENDRTLLNPITQERPAHQFERSQRTGKQFYHSAKKPQHFSRILSNQKPTIEKKPADKARSPAHKNSFSSKREQKKQQPLTEPLRKGQVWHENIQQKYQENKQKQNRKIQQIIEFLRKKLSHKCAIQSHEWNRILYVCLQQNCPSRIGCSYCFLHSHENHLKSEISTCIKDLQELSFKVNASQQLFSKKANNFYVQFHEKLNHEVQNIRNQFQTNLSFVKMKTQTQFESYYKEKYLPYLEKHFTKVSEFRIDSNVGQKQVSPLKRLKQSTQKNSKSDDAVKQKEMLTNLAELKFEQIYSYLAKRSEILHLEFAESNILLEFFEEMNSSLTKFFSAFKRNLPKIFAERIFLQKPLIICSS